jgi:alpha/beta superfamily hydrolase
MVAMGAAGKSSLVKAIAAVSPVMSAGALEGCPIPKYIITGADDQVVSAGSVRQGAEGMAASKKIEIIEGADHFWWGQSAMVGKRVAGFFAGVFLK